MSKTNDTFRELTEANLDAVSLEELESVSGGVELVHEAAHAEVSARPRNSHATLLIRKGVIQAELASVSGGADVLGALQSFAACMPQYVSGYENARNEVIREATPA